MAATDARSGVWIDYNRSWINKPQVLVTDFWSRFMTSVVAVCLTLVSPYMFKILQRLFCWALRSSTSSSSHQNPTEERVPLLDGRADHADEDASTGENTSEINGALVPYQGGNQETLQSPHTEPNGVASHSASRTRPVEKDSIVSDMLQHSESSRDFVWRCIKHVWRGDKRWLDFIFLIILVLIIVFVAWTIVGILSANIASDSTGLSSSKHCGIWQFDDNAGDDAAYRDDLYNRQKEEQTSQYAQNCYDNPDAADTLSCKIFYNQSIGFETKTQQPCPLRSAEMCFNGLYSAITFDTGPVDASIIGINHKPTYRFRRRTTCSPLNMSKPYISRHSEDPKDDMYYYNYGPLDDTNYTFNTSGRPFDWLVPVYSANAKFSSLYPANDYWHPIPELKQPAGSSLTIIFVSSMHIFHISPSYDPVFPAEKRRAVQGSFEDYFYNSDPRARPLACVDTSQVCSVNGKKCWGMRDIVPPAMFSDPSFWLMKWSLESSTIYDSIGWRLGAAFQAQKMVSQFISLPLPNNQWEIEARQLFATSLARIQFDAWNIATGEGRERPGYVEVTPDEGRRNLCGLYKFKTADYTNVNLLAFIGYVLLALVIYVSSWEILLEQEGGQSTKVLIIGAILTNPRAFAKAVGAPIMSVSSSVIRFFRQFIRGRTTE